MMFDNLYCAQIGFGLNWLIIIISKYLLITVCHWVSSEFVINGLVIDIIIAVHRFFFSSNA